MVKGGGGEGEGRGEMGVSHQLSRSPPRGVCVCVFAWVCVCLRVCVCARVGVRACVRQRPPFARQLRVCVCVCVLTPEHRGAVLVS